MHLSYEIQLTLLVVHFVFASKAEQLSWVTILLAFKTVASVHSLNLHLVASQKHLPSFPLLLHANSVKYVSHFPYGKHYLPSEIHVGNFVQEACVL